MRSSLRIVGGRLSGQRLLGPKGLKTRPTSERVREAIGSILQSRDAIDGASVLDLFSGTGALAFEMLSRGATRAVAVDWDTSMISVLAENARRLAAPIRGVSLNLEGAPEKIARSLTRHGPWNLVLADPPYADVAVLGPLLDALIREGGVSADAYILIEHAEGHPASLPPPLAILATYRYGGTGLILAVANASSENGEHP